MLFSSLSDGFSQPPQQTKILTAVGSFCRNIRSFRFIWSSLAPEANEDDIEVTAFHRSLRELTQEIFSLSLTVPDEAVEGLQRIAESDMSDEARKKAKRELQRLEEMWPQSAEYSIVKHT